MPNMGAEFDRLMKEIERTVLEYIESASLKMQCPRCGQYILIPLNGTGEGYSITCGCGTLISLDQT